MFIVIKCKGVGRQYTLYYSFNILIYKILFKFYVYLISSKIKVGKIDSSHEKIVREDRKLVVSLFPKIQQEMLNPREHATESWRRCPPTTSEQSRADLTGPLPFLLYVQPLMVLLDQNSLLPQC